MSKIEKLTNALQEREREEPKKTLEQILFKDSVISSFKKVLPQYMDAERFCRIILSDARQSPAILKCDPMSIISSAMDAARLGLETGSVMGYAYLIPYGTKCTLVIGYKGMNVLAARLGYYVSTRVVYSNDEFEMDLCNHKFYHKPNLIDEPGERLLTYASVKTPTDKIIFDFLPERDLNKIPEKLRQYKRYHTAKLWDEYPEKMRMKTVNRKIFNSGSVPMYFNTMTEGAVIYETPQNGSRMSEIIEGVSLPSEDAENAVEAIERAEMGIENYTETEGGFLSE